MKYKVYIANLYKRKDRKRSINQQFSNKIEFEAHIVYAKERKNGARGLWDTFIEILSQEKHSDVFIFCEDDHVFTNDYDYNFLRTQIENAFFLKADILIGGISWFNTVIQLNDNLFWIDRFSGTQFIVIFKIFFDKLLNYEFKNGIDTLDSIICKLSEEKLLIYPMISIQKDFGYSDATSQNNDIGRVDFLFNQTIASLRSFTKIRNFYDSLNVKSQKE